MNDSPYILTLRMDDETFHLVDDLRQKYFPRHLNFLRAHVTLFHKLPHERPTLEFVDSCCRKITSFSFNLTTPVFTGRGVGLKVESSILSDLQRTMREHWLDVLSPQDKQPYKPHVTVQNKVEPQVARLLYNELIVNFKPVQGQATGLTVHEYLGGPWKTLETFYFL